MDTPCYIVVAPLQQHFSLIPIVKIGDLSKSCNITTLTDIISTYGNDNVKIMRTDNIVVMPTRPLTPDAQHAYYDVRKMHIRTDRTPKIGAYYISRDAKDDDYVTNNVKIIKHRDNITQVLQKYQHKYRKNTLNV